MKTILYYTVYKGITIINEKFGAVLDGTKSAHVYKIENNIPVIVCNVHIADLASNTVNHIKMYLESELNMDTENVELKNL